MIYLRTVNDNDLPLILAWRNNKEIYQGFYQQKGNISWEEHVQWWGSRNNNWFSFMIIMVEKNRARPIGVINIGQTEHHSPEIGYMIGEITLWGTGIGTEAVKKGIEWVKEYYKTHKHITSVHTTIKDNNIASIKLIKKLGFKKGMKARKGESYWIRQLSRPS